MPCIYRDIALVLEAKESLACGMLLIYEVTSADKKTLCGACAANGEVRVPEYSSVDPMLFVPYEDAGAGGGGTGVWSLALGCQLLGCKYDAVYGFRIDEQTYFLAQTRRRGWTIAREDAADGPVLQLVPRCQLDRKRAASPILDRRREAKRSNYGTRTSWGVSR